MERTGKFRRAMALGLGVVLALWALAGVAGVAGHLGWIAELFANFPAVPILVAIAAAILLGRNAGRLAGVAGAAVAIAVVVLTMIPAPVLAPGGGGSTLKFATWNACLGALDPASALGWIEANDPDVVAFTEISKPLHSALEKKLRLRYPYYAGDPRNGAAGLAVFSKIPVSNWRRASRRAFHASCDLAWPDGPVCRLVLVHPPAPTSGTWFERRAGVLSEVAGELESELRPRIVLGDFNATWRAADFRTFCARAGVRPASGFRPSWPAWLPRRLRIPIDHVLADPRNFFAGAASSGDLGNGSDHLPVLAEIGLLRGPGAAR